MIYEAVSVRSVLKSLVGLVSGMLTLKGKAMATNDPRVRGIFVLIGFILVIGFALSQCFDDTQTNPNVQAAMTEVAKKRVPLYTLKADWCDREDLENCVINAVTWSPKKNLVAISTQSSNSGKYGPKIIIWNIETNSLEKVIEQLNITFNSLAWSRDGSLLAAGGSIAESESASGYENFAVWNTKSWDRVTGMRTEDFLDNSGNKVYSKSDIYRMLPSPQGNYLAIQMKHSILVYDLNSLNVFRRIVNLNGDWDEITSVTWSPDSLYLAVGDNKGRIRFWNVASGEKDGELEENGQVVFAIWPWDRTKVLSSDGNTLHCWDMKKGAVAWELVNINPYSLSPSPNSERIAIGTEDGRILILNGKDGKVLVVNKHDGTPQPDEKVLEDDQIGHGNIRVSWSRDGSRLAAYTADIGAIWKTNQWERIQKNTVDYDKRYFNISWSYNGEYYLTWSWRGNQNMKSGTQLPLIDVWSGN